ncbi:MAG: PH domain-containing protein [Pseudomonadota bacterium]
MGSDRGPQAPGSGQGDPQAEAGADPLARWRALHPASPLINLLPQAWRILRGYWPLLLAVVVGTRASASWLDLLLIPGFMLAPAARTFIHWATLRYRIHDGRLEIRSGLLNRQVRLIGPDRIQNAELVRNPFHRLAGLVEVRLETAGGDRTEGLLSALTRPDAEALMARIQALQAAHGATGPAVPAPEPEAVLYRQGVLELLAHGLTSRRAGVMAVLVAVGLELWQQTGGGDPEALRAGLHPAFVAGLVLASFALGVALAVGDALLRYHDLRLVERGDRVEVRHGLLTRRQVGLQRRRIQLLQVSEPLIRRAMGYATLHLETAGLSAGPDGIRQAEATLPMVDREQLAHLCRALLPDLDRDPWSDRLEPAPLRALGLGLLGALLRGLLLLALGLYLGGTWGLATLATWPVLAISAWFDWRWQAWCVTERVVLTRRGFWNRRTTIIPRRKVQSTLCHEGPLLRACGLARVLIRGAGSSTWMPALRTETTQAILGCAPGRPTPPAQETG